MYKTLEIISAFRKYILHKTEALTIDQLNEIPAGFSNNIIWNMGHMNATFQALVYRNSGLPMQLSDEYFFPFLPGTNPEKAVDVNGIEIIKSQFLSMTDKIHSDLEAGIFKTYKSPEKIERVYGIKVENVEDAIAYATSHEGLHMNAILTIQRLITLPKT